MLVKVIRKKDLILDLIDHPYDSNLDLIAKVNFFFFSQDKKFAMAYYESPPGWFDVEVNGFDEVDYMIKGEVELKSDTKTIVARQGDCFHITDGDRFRWTMKKPSKMLFFIYPLTNEINDLIASFYDRK